MASSSKPILLSFTIFFLVSTPVITLTKESFSIYIIHRDSSKSPMFDNTTTHFQRIHNALLRSNDRVNALFSNNASTINDDDPHPIMLGYGLGEYIMQYSLGSPQFTTYGIVDTGSSFPWVQCKPSLSSYNQGLLQFLDTTVSRGLVPVNYCTDMCNHVVRSSVSKVDDDPSNCQCMYAQEYASNAGSYGYVFYSLLRLQTINGAYVGFPTFVFGCSRAYQGSFAPEASGIIGFGRDPASLVSQIYDRIDGKFAYCLVPIGGPHIYSEMRFGQSAVIAGPDVVYTPLVAGELAGHYWVSFEGISVGNRRIHYIAGELDNMVIDSGTVVTRLPQEVYAEVEAEVEAELDLLHQRTLDPSAIHNLCYLQNNIEAMGGPTIIFHLRGSDLVLSAENIYILVDHQMVCFNFIPMAIEKVVLGAMTQSNFMVTFDLQRAEVSFKKVNCAIYNN